jgi:hypothetical protein
VDPYPKLGPPKYILHCLFNDAIGRLNYIAFNGRTIRQKLTETGVEGNSCRLVEVTRRGMSRRTKKYHKKNCSELRSSSYDSWIEKLSLGH